MQLDASCIVHRHIEGGLLLLFILLTMVLDELFTCLCGCCGVLIPLDVHKHLAIHLCCECGSFASAAEHTIATVVLCV